jgi:probable phosphoglycerate mutase
MTVPPVRIRHPQRSSSSSLGAASAAFRNQLEESSSLNNDYFALRHGQSLANVAQIIVSNPEIACHNYGLSEVGKEQAKTAGATVVQHYTQSSHPQNYYKGVLLLSSDLLRAKETAEIVAEALQAASIPLYYDNHHNDVVIETRLRERGFGAWDGGSDKHYPDVWKDDAMDPTHEIQGVESVLSVMDRATQCIREWDTLVQNHMVICVAHGDVLQILQTAFTKLDGSKHRTLEHLETATLRRLELATNKQP